ncbi:hypothetical protein CBL_05564 [Carabus blaptoides fortunei]
MDVEAYLCWDGLELGECKRDNDKSVVCPIMACAHQRIVVRRRDLLVAEEKCFEPDWKLRVPASDNRCSPETTESLVAHSVAFVNIAKCSNSGRMLHARRPAWLLLLVRVLCSAKQNSPLERVHDSPTKALVRFPVAVVEP